MTITSSLGPNGYEVSIPAPVSGGRGVYVFDVTSVSGAANTSEQILKQYLLPVGLLMSTNYIRLALLVGKSGTSENMTLRIRLGSAGTTADAQLTSITAPSLSTRSNSSEFHFFAANATTVRHLGAAPFAGMLGGNSLIVPPVNVTVPDMSTTALYLSVTAQMATGVETPAVHHVVLCRE